MEILQSCPPTVDQQFINDDGSIENIHIVGDRTVKGTFFKAMDVANLVGVSKATYVASNLDDDMKVKIMMRNSEVLYINTIGLLFFLLPKRNVRATAFVKWVLDTVIAFTLNAREKVPEKRKPSMAAMFQRDVFKVPFESGVYVIKVGSAGDLKSRCSKPVSIGDDTPVYMFGMSKTSIARRLGENDNAFDNGVLVLQAFVPPDLVKKTDAAIRDYVNKCSATALFPYEKHQEMFSVLSNEDDTAALRVIGDIKDIVGEINRCGSSGEIERLQKICEVKDDEIKTNDSAFLNELQDRDMHHAKLMKFSIYEVDILKLSLDNYKRLLSEERCRNVEVTNELLEVYRTKRCKVEEMT